MDVVVGKSGREFPVAHRELSSEEVGDLYGPAILEAEAAFEEDPVYFALMAENGRAIRSKRK